MIIGGLSCFVPLSMSEWEWVDIREEDNSEAAARVERKRDERQNGEVG